MIKTANKITLIVMATIMSGCSMMPSCERPGALTSGDWQKYFPDVRTMAELKYLPAGRTSASVVVAETRKVIDVSEYEKTMHQAFREAADLLNAHDKLSEQLAARQANADAQKQRQLLLDALFKAGIANHLDVLDAQRESFSADQGAAQVRRLWLSASAQLYKALGGEGNASAAKTAQEVVSR